MDGASFFYLALVGAALAVTIGYLASLLKFVFGGLVLRLWREWSTPKPVRTHTKAPHPLSLTRTKHNPILRQSSYDWEAEAVMNPAAVETSEKTHLFYRALGRDGVSRIGYASSRDGTTVDERLPYPVFSLDGLDPNDETKRRDLEARYPALVASGGSWGGTEDPRAVAIEDRVYLSFSAFHNWSSLRMAVTSIATDDLIAGTWKWKRPAFLSAPNQVHKNWVLFPEKIRGKFAILHSIFPKIDVAYVDDLETVGRTTPYIESYQGARSDSADVFSHSWHERVRGAGPPPLKTPYGWLLLYHAMEKGQPDKYKMGAALLDADDPSRVLARAAHPILGPDAWYENDGKPGIVYACGAVVKDGMLRVYYGGADRVVCTATAHLTSFVQALLNQKRPHLTEVPEVHRGFAFA